MKLAKPLADFRFVSYIETLAPRYQQVIRWLASLVSVDNDSALFTLLNMRDNLRFSTTSAAIHMLRNLERLRVIKVKTDEHSSLIEVEFYRP